MQTIWFILKIVLCSIGLFIHSGVPKLNYFRIFAVIQKHIIRYKGLEVHNLNELEFVNGEVWANVWQVILFLYHLRYIIGIFLGIQLLWFVYLGCPSRFSTYAEPLEACGVAN